MEALKCSVCGGAIMAGDSFCSNCGSPVTVIATAQEVPVVEEAAQTVQEPAAPVVEEAAQTVQEQAAPVVEEAAQAVQETAAPVVEEAVQTVQEPAAPDVEEAAQAVQEQAAPVVEEAAQTVQETVAPVVEEAVQESYSQETTVLNQNPYSTPQPDMNTSTSGYASSAAYSVPQQAYTDSSQNTYTEVYDEPEKKESKIFGLIGMICGIASILCCVCGPVLAIPGVILSIVGMVKKEKKTFPIVGIITSALGFIIGIIVIIVLVVGIDEWM